MRVIRFVIAALLTMSLAVLPMSAGMAMSRTAMAEMSTGASGHDCPCCNAAHKCAPDQCMLKCFSVSAIALDVSPLVAPLPAPFAAATMTTLVAFSARPDPPPPRS